MKTSDPALVKKMLTDEAEQLVARGMKIAAAIPVAYLRGAMASLSDHRFALLACPQEPLKTTRQLIGQALTALDPTGPSYTIASGGITCHRCGMISFSRGDVEQCYCVKCHIFHEDPRSHAEGPDRGSEAPR